MDCLQWKLGVEHQNHKLAEAEVASLKQCMQIQDKEGKCKEFRHLIAAEAETNSDLKQLIMSESERRKKWGEKL